MKPYWKLRCAAGTYSADSLLGLVVEILRHRTRHLLNGDGWCD